MRNDVDGVEDSQGSIPKASRTRAPQIVNVEAGGLNPPPAEAVEHAGTKPRIHCDKITVAGRLGNRLSQNGSFHISTVLKRKYCDGCIGTLVILRQEARM